MDRLAHLKCLSLPTEIGKFSHWYRNFDPLPWMCLTFQEATSSGQISFLLWVNRFFSLVEPDCDLRLQCVGELHPHTQISASDALQNKVDNRMFVIALDLGWANDIRDYAQL